MARRACLLLKTSQCDLFEGQVSIALSQARKPEMALKSIAPHYARHLAKTQPGAFAAPVRSTLDAGLQRFAVQSLKRHLRELMQRQVEDGAVLVLDRASGEVLAWVGSSGALSDAGQV